MNLTTVKNGLTFAVGRSGLVLKKYSPEILMGIGIVGTVASTVMACKATLKAEDVLIEKKNKLDVVKTAHATVEAEKYSEKDYKKDLAVVYTETAVDFIKLYGPAVTLGLASIGCMLGAHGIMRRRNVALIAAYKAVEKSFGDYRKRVVDELGVDKDREFKYGIKKDSHVEEVTDKDGNINRVRVEDNVVNPNNISQYARFFDRSSKHWSNTPGMNAMTLKSLQNYANDLLQARGHVFLNEVYEMLGIPHSQEGQLVGWVKDNGDNFIDFGVFNVSVKTDAYGLAEGNNDSILLDFNVDGVVYNLI